MELEFIKPKVFAGKRYHGEITRFKPNREQTALFIFVRLDDEPNMEFMKRFDADMSIQSHLADFCRAMKVLIGERRRLDYGKQSGNEIFAKGYQ